VYSLAGVQLAVGKGKAAHHSDFELFSQPAGHSTTISTFRFRPSKAKSVILSANAIMADEYVRFESKQLREPCPFPSAPRASFAASSAHAVTATTC